MKLSTVMMDETIERVSVMKKRISLLLASLSILAGCSSAPTENTSVENEKRSPNQAHKFINRP